MKQPRTSFHFFWKGPFSQWERRPMVIDGQVYGSCEQYMMAEKARLFGDEESERLILATLKSSEQKALGKLVKNFDQDIWGANCRDIVYQGNIAKFSQHKDLRNLLLETGDKHLVEASPYDTIWGIGMAEDHLEICDPDKWKGTNWLGEALMEVRRELQYQRGQYWPGSTPRDTQQQIDDALVKPRFSQRG